MKPIGYSPVLCFIWRKVYSHWLDDDEYVARVYGWRSARIRNKYGTVRWIEPCFLWFQ